MTIHVGLTDGARVGELLENIPNGIGTSTFGWLSWDGDQGINTLVQSLTPPGASGLYINPNNPADSVLSSGDWVRGRATASNARPIRDALDGLMGRLITIPLWDEVKGQEGNVRYHIVGVAQIRLTAYHLPGNNRLSFRYEGQASCGNQLP